MGSFFSFLKLPSGPLNRWPLTVGVDRAPIDLFLARMFCARRAVIGSAAVFVGLLLAYSLGRHVFLMTESACAPFLRALWAVLLIVLCGSALTGYYVFRAGLREMGFGYAAGHLLLCIALTPIILIGIMVIPLLVCYDIETSRRGGESDQRKNEQPMSASAREAPTILFGWLVCGLLFGAGLGFALVDVRAARAGYDWSSGRFLDETLPCTIGGAYVGIAVGVVFDAAGRALEWTRAAIRWAWWFLLFSLFAYELIRPALECARE
jgi:hypothetical protein